MIGRHGVVVRGHRVASTACRDPRFPSGTIAPQLSFLRSAVSDFDAHLGETPHCGTINVSFGDRRVEIVRPEYLVQSVKWTEAFAPETFHLSKAFIVAGERLYPSFLYVPEPTTKPDHVQPADSVEVLSRYIQGLAYGDPVTLFFSPHALNVTQA